MSSGLLKFLSLLLAFTLGFLACAGGLVLGGVLIYNNVSYETLQGWGVPLPSVDKYLDSHADVRLTAMTFSALFEEMQMVMEYSDELTLNTLVDRYGVKIPEKYEAYLPPAMMELALSTLASRDGISYVLSNTTVDFVLQLVPDDMLSEPARDAMSDKSLKDMMKFDMGDLFSEMKLGYLMDLNYQKNDAGEWELIYANPDKPSTREMIAPLSLGPVLDAAMHGGDLLGIVKADIGDCELSAFLGKDTEGLAGALTEGRTIGDVILYNSDSGKHEMSFDQLLDDTKVGEMMGWEAVAAPTAEDPDAVIWQDENGEAATGIMKAFADMSIKELSEADSVQNKIDDLLLYEALGYTYDEAEDAYYDGDIKVTGVLDVLAPKRIDTLGEGIDDIKVGEMLGWTATTDPQDETATLWLDKNGDPAEGVMKNFADLTVKELSENQNGEVDDALNKTCLYEALGYTKEVDEHGKVVYKDDGTEVKGILAVLAPKPIGELGEGIDEMKIGEVMEMTAVYDETQTPPALQYWEDKNGEEATGVMAAFANLTVEQMSDPAVVQDTIDGMQLYEVMGWKKVDGVWQDASGGAISGVMTALAESTVSSLDNDVQQVNIGQAIGWTHDGVQWLDGDLPAEGIMLSFADLTLDEMGDPALVQDATQGILLYEALGYTKEVDASGKVIYMDGDREVKGLLAVLAPKTVGSVGENAGDILVGEMMGWTPNYVPNTEPPEIESWTDASGDPAGGFVVAFANLTLDEMADSNKVQETVNNLHLYEVMGYTYDETNQVYKNGDEVVTGIPAALAPERVKDLDATISNLRLKDVFTPEQRSSGFLALLDENTRLYASDGEAGLADAVTEAFTTTGVGELINDGVPGGADLISLDQSTLDALDLIDASKSKPVGYWRTLTLQDLIVYLATPVTP